MPRGFLQAEFLNGPVHKPKAEIFSDLDAYTMEFFSDEEEFRDRLDLFVPLPPIEYEGVFTKGILFTQAADYLVERFPWVKELFHVGAYSMWCSYPRSVQADFYLACYENPERERWFRETSPERVDIVLVALQDGDFTNEYLVAPRLVEERDIDILCVCKLEVRKNLTALAEAIKVYHKKYQPIRTVLVTGQEFDFNLQGLNPEGRQEMRRLQEVLHHTQDYLEILGAVPYYELPDYYSRSQALVLPSYIEGKNRSLSEAMSCNTPVVCFEQFNRYARGPQPAFPAGAGVTAELGPEGLADAFHETLSNRETFKPRRAYLEQYGRRHFLDRVMRALPYYQKQLPDFDASRPSGSLWLQLGLQLLFQMSLDTYLYDDLTTARAWCQGIDQVGLVMEEFQLRYAHRLP
jgi:glycosyltransferase involved in cell wall biosynthesis